MPLDKHSNRPTSSLVRHLKGGRQQIDPVARNPFRKGYGEMDWGHPKDKYGRTIRVENENEDVSESPVPPIPGSDS